MACVADDGDRYRFRLLEKVTDRTLYPSQLTGAMGIILKLFGKIDADKLLEAYVGFEGEEFISTSLTPFI